MSYTIILNAECAYTDDPSTEHRPEQALTGHEPDQEADYPANYVGDCRGSGGQPRPFPEPTTNRARKYIEFPFIEVDILKGDGESFLRCIRNAVGKGFFKPQYAASSFELHD
uniref:(northern house mosquito) hypothetical protein n=1 Tax=Culex pipiens TaxID=7175 RepID=A0A8D8B612_CULPI